MTDTELREIDAQVHREVMGIVWDESRCRGCGWPIVPEGEQGCWASNCSMRPYPDQRADEPPHYSSSIAAAWQVVEKCGMTIRPAGLGINGKRCHWFAGFTCAIHEHRDLPFDHVDNPTMAHADTAPLAICLAALKAVRGDMGQSGA